MNNLADIERQAKMLMTAHGVGRMAFKFDNAKRRIGATHITVTTGGQRIPHTISLSRHFVIQMTTEQIREVMLHEIAHALTPNDKGHGPAWRTKARSLGINPNRCMESGVKIEKVWQAVCPSCHKNVGGGMHRAPKTVKACAQCRHLPFADRIVNWKKNGVLVPAQDISPTYYKAFASFHMRQSLTKPA